MEDHELTKCKTNKLVEIYTHVSIRNIVSPVDYYFSDKKNKRMIYSFITPYWHAKQLCHFYSNYNP